MQNMGSTAIMVQKIGGPRPPMAPPGAATAAGMARALSSHNSATTTAYLAIYGAKFEA